MLAGMAVAARPARASGLGDMLWEHTLDYLRRVDEKRRESFAAIETPEDLEHLRRRVKAKLEAMWGPLPGERTPLNSRHLGTIERPGYRTVTTTVDVKAGERARVAARLEGGSNEE